MRKRVLLIVHESLVPPDDTDDLSDSKAEELRTELDVLAALRALRFDVRIIGIGDYLTELRETIRDWKPHIVFNLLEEFSGIVSYDHYVVAFLELMRQPYTGCNPRGMMISRDKLLTKRVLASHRIRTPASRLLPFGQRYREPRRLEYPLFVKSATEDASLGISQASLVEDPKRLRERVEFIHRHVQSDALVEEYVDGREFYVGVLGNSRLTTLPVWELDFGTLSKNRAPIATRKVKWDANYRLHHGIRTREARNLSAEQTSALTRLAKRIFRALYMTGYARMDLRMSDDGQVFLLEANANPSLARREDLAESADAAGLCYQRLIERIVSLGLAYRPEWRMFEA